MSTLDLKRRLLDSNLLRTETVTIEGIDEPVILREMSVAKVRDLTKKIAKAQKEDDSSAALNIMLEAFVLSCVDEDGNQVFTVADVEALSKTLPLDLAKSLGTAAMKHSRLTKDSATEIQEEVEKNSEKVESSDSASA
jgi:hypothetical protein